MRPDADGALAAGLAMKIVPGVSGITVVRAKRHQSVAGCVISLDHQPDVPVPRKIDRHLYVLHCSRIDHIVGEPSPRAIAPWTRLYRTRIALRPPRQNIQRVVDPEAAATALAEDPVASFTVIQCVVRIADCAGGLRAEQGTIEGAVEADPVLRGRPCGIAGEGFAFWTGRDRLL